MADAMRIKLVPCGKALVMSEADFRRMEKLVPDREHRGAIQARA